MHEFAVVGGEGAVFALAGEGGGKAEVFQGGVVDEVAAFVAEDEAAGGLDRCSAIIRLEGKVRGWGGGVLTEGVVLVVSVAGETDVGALQAEVSHAGGGGRLVAAFVRGVGDVAFFLQRLDQAGVAFGGLLAGLLEEASDVCWRKVRTSAWCKLYAVTHCSQRRQAKAWLAS